MKKFCLTYDAKQSELWEPDELKLKIAKVLISEEAKELSSSTRSTITFKDSTNSTLKKWKALIERELEADIYYYLCMIAKTESGTQLDIDKGNIELAEAFQVLIEKL